MARKKNEKHVTFPRVTWLLHVTVTFKRHIKTRIEKSLFGDRTYRDASGFGNPSYKSTDGGLVMVSDSRRLSF